MIRVALVLGLCFGSQVWAEDSADDALKKTQEMLKNPAARTKAASESAEGKKSLENLHQLTGGDAQTEQEIWNMAAELMPMLNGEAKGDPKQMNEILDAAKLNPEEFAKRFPAAQKQKLQEIAEKLSKKQQKKP